MAALSAIAVTEFLGRFRRDGTGKNAWQNFLLPLSFAITAAVQIVILKAYAVRFSGVLVPLIIACVGAAVLLLLVVKLIKKDMRLLTGLAAGLAVAGLLAAPAYWAYTPVAVDTVQMRALGDPSVRFGALLSGTVDATMITIGNARIAQAKGFRILAYSGDYVSALSANLETSDDKIKTSPAEVYRVVKATLKGQIFYHRNMNEAAKFVMEALRINDFNEAKEIWRERDKQASDLAKIGRASEEVMTTNIERVREQMRAVGATSRIKGPVTLDQVYDFSFVQKAYDDIRASKWDPMRYEYSKR
jgi:hypothetical protein